MDHRAPQRAITGPTGVGKSYIACAIGHAACRADHSVRSFRLPRLIDELTRHTALQNKPTFLRQLAKADLIIINDFGLAPLPDAIRRDLLEILDDRYDCRSTLITSQLPVEQWHTYLEGSTSDGWQIRLGALPTCCKSDQDSKSASVRIASGVCAG